MECKTNLLVASDHEQVKAGETAVKGEGLCGLALVFTTADWVVDRLDDRIHEFVHGGVKKHAKRLTRLITTGRLVT